MLERLKQLPKQLLEFWNKYTARQKAVLISVVATIIIAFAVLIYITGRVEYKELTTAETAKDASKIIDVLESEGIKYKLASDNVTIYVDRKRISDAVILLAKNDIPSTGITLDELLDNSLSTTNSDRNLKLNLFIQNNLRNSIKKMEGVEDAEIYYIPVDNTNTILNTQKDTSASVLLTVNDNFKK